MDLFLPAGKQLTLRAHKMPDKDHEQIFSTQFTLIADVAKRIDVRLSQPQLTPTAQKAHDLKVALQKEQAAKEARQREMAAAQKDLLAAQGGDITAMAVMAQRYETGKGVQKDPAKARSWHTKIDQIHAEKAANADLKSAQAGDTKSMQSMVRRYKHGEGVQKNSAQAKAWQLKINAIEEKIKQDTIARNKRQDAARKRAQLQTEKDAISYRKNQKAFDDWIGNRGASGPLEALATVTISLPAIAGALLMDTVSSPTRVSESMKISKKLNAHASAWAKPNSMMAKAYRQQQASSTVNETLILASR